MSEISLEQALRRLPPARPTTLDRMRDAAAAERSRIESSQLTRLSAGLITDPMPWQMARRDDFSGMVDLIDLILSDQELLDRLRDRRRAQKAAARPARDDASHRADITCGDDEIGPT